jgi:hypothetical protein
MDNKNIIYVNRDSFAAGSDLGDFILPEYPSKACQVLNQL